MDRRATWRKDVGHADGCQARPQAAIPGAQMPTQGLPRPARFIAIFRAGWCRPGCNRPDWGGAMTEFRGYFAVGPPADDSNYVTGSAVRNKVRIAASPTAWLTPAEARKLAQYLLFAAGRAEEGDA